MFTLSIPDLTILSLDGGGMRGLGSVLLLQELERRLGTLAEHHKLPSPRLADCFDIISGTSTGGLVAAGISGAFPDGRPIATTEMLVHFYRTRARSVFVRRASFSDRGLMSPYFHGGRLYRQFRDICGEARLSDSLTNVMIPAFDIENARVHVFRGGPAWRNAGADEFLLRDVILATTAAPTYFEPVRVFAIGRMKRLVLVDGGVALNNPVVRAYAAGRDLVRNAHRVLVVSIGSGSDDLRLDYHEARGWGLAQWLNPARRLPLLHITLAAQSAEAHHQMRQMIWDETQYIRFEPDYRGRPPDLSDISPDAVRKIDAAAANLIDASEDKLDLVARRLFDRALRRKNSAR